MRRYVLFNGQTYYPGGGWDDFHSAHDTYEQAKLMGKSLMDKYDWYQIVDIENGEIVSKDDD